MAQVAFHGNIGKVRELQFSQDGKARIGFSVGESHSKFNKQSNQWEDTGVTWRNVTVFGKRAEALAEVLREGAKQKVVVIGREETREYEHNGEKRTSLDCVAEVVGLIPAAQQSQGGGFQQPSQQSAPPQQQGGNWNAPANDPWSSGGQQNNGGWGNPSDKPAF